jgi:hypothetical protein
LRFLQLSCQYVDAVAPMAIKWILLWNVVEFYWDRNTEKVLGEELVSVSRFPPQILGGMPWNRTRISASMIRRYELPDVCLEYILIHRIFMYWLYFRSGASFLLCMTVGWGGACFVICVKQDPWGILSTVSSHHIPTLLVLLQTQFLLFLKNVFPTEYICFRWKYVRNKHLARIPWNSCKHGRHKQAIKSVFAQYNLVQRKGDILRCLDKADAARN